MVFGVFGPRGLFRLRHTYYINDTNDPSSPNSGAAAGSQARESSNALHFIMTIAVTRFDGTKRREDAMRFVVGQPCRGPWGPAGPGAAISSVAIFALPEPTQAIR